MRKPSVASGALVGLLLTVPLIAVLYLANRLAGLAFPPFDAFDWLRDKVPGGILNTGIEGLARTLTALGLSLRSASKPAEIIMVLGMFLAMGVIVGAFLFAILRHARESWKMWAGLILGAAVGFPLTAITLTLHRASGIHSLDNPLWTLAIFLIWGYAFVWAYNTLAGKLHGHEIAHGERMTVEKIGRRKFLISLGAASAAISVVGAGLGSVLGTRIREGKKVPLSASAAPTKSGLATGESVQAGGLFAPAPGTRPEYTPLEDHYRIDINLTPPVIDAQTWSLPIAGLVRNPVRLSLSDLMTKYESMDQLITLSCISNTIGGDLISTTRWTGVRVQKILDEAGVKDEARLLSLESADGFYESVPLNLIRQDERIMFAYAWDGKPLEAKHGFPLRIYIPDRYGMKQPKWITKAELVADSRPGYWVERGWDREAHARATSVIDTVAVKDVVTAENGDRLVPIGGIAWAGARGVSEVELKVDDGEWIKAGLRKPLSGLTWVIWRYDWPFRAGSHTFYVRCREADGAPQIETPSGAFPSGATGLHHVKKKL